jgi:hypothetical protein
MRPISRAPGIGDFCCHLWDGMGQLKVYALTVPTGWAQLWKDEGNANHSVGIEAGLALHLESPPMPFWCFHEHFYQGLLRVISCVYFRINHIQSILSFAFPGISTNNATFFYSNGRLLFGLHLRILVHCKCQHSVSPFFLPSFMDFFAPS